MNFVFWQVHVGQHMSGIAEALVRQGHDVSCVAEGVLSDARAKQGWVRPQLEGVRVKLCSSSQDILTIVDKTPEDAVHMCQGIRNNGLVAVAQRALVERRRRQWIIMEAVDDRNGFGWLKRLEYRRRFFLARRHVEAVLAIGKRTGDWLQAVGVPAGRVFPFAYFLPPYVNELPPGASPAPRFRFIMVGLVCRRKRIDLLLDALTLLQSDLEWELVVVGSGQLEGSLRAKAQRELGVRVAWTGKLSHGDVVGRIATSDCLVLPSRHDGWGAVISEALMLGVPVVCSDACGASIAVEASGEGGVFRSGDVRDLADRLGQMIQRGSRSRPERASLASWAQCLGADAGAGYLSDIVEHLYKGSARPAPPWDSR